MFSQHIEAKVFHCLNVVNHRLVGRRSEHTVAPISLIEKTFVEIRFVVEEQTFLAGFVNAFRELTHAKITSDHIVVANDHDVVKVRVLGRPEFHIFNWNHDFFSAFEIHVRNDVIAVHDNDFSLAFRGFICRNDNFNYLSSISGVILIFSMKVSGVLSSHTVCQIPLCGVYHIPVPFSVCLPRH